LVASAGDDRSIRIWDVAAKQLLHTLSGHENTVEALAFAPNDDKLVSGSADGTLRFWTLDGSAISTLEIPSRIKALAISPDGNLAATGGSDGAVRIWNVALRRELCTASAHKNTVYCVAFHPTDDLLASTGFDRTIHLWRLMR
jgi:WD40 repeat protein